MISGSLNIHAPFWRKTGWKSYWDRYWMVSQHKVFEVQLMRSFDLIGLYFELTFWGRNHAGPKLRISLLGFELVLDIYDTRHWNWETSSWQSEAT